MARLKGVTVTIDTSKEHSIKVLLPNINSSAFKEWNDGLYHLKINEINKDVMYDSCPQIFNKKHIPHVGKLWEQKNPDFYNRKLGDQVTLLSNKLSPIIW